MAEAQIKTLLTGTDSETTDTGDAVDVRRFQAMTLVLRVTEVTGSPTSLDVKLQHSADGTNFGDFKTAVAFTQVTTSTTEESLRLGSVALGWVRAVGTIVGGGTGKDYTYVVYAVGNY
jgi:hypothetical protein